MPFPRACSFAPLLRTASEWSANHSEGVYFYKIHNNFETERFNTEVEAHPAMWESRAASYPKFMILIFNLSCSTQLPFQTPYRNVS